MVYKPTPEEIGEYFRDEVARFANTVIPGQTIFTIECNCDPHSGGLPIKFTVWNTKIGETIAAGNMADAIAEAERRYLIKTHLAPLMIARHPALEDPVPAAVEGDATPRYNQEPNGPIVLDDEIPF